MEKYYFTFCLRQPLRNCFVVFEGTYADARAQMAKNFGTEWAFQYSEGGWIRDGLSQEDQFHLTEIKI